MVMGRPNKGIGHVNNCDGSRQSKQRARVILQTITGELSVNEACAKLGIQRPQFAKLRAKAMQGTVDALEPGRPGRPRRHDVESEQREAELQAKIAQLENQLHVEQIRAAVVQILPGRGDGQKGGATARRPKPKRRRR